MFEGTATAPPPADAPRLGRARRFGPVARSGWAARLGRGDRAAIGVVLGAHAALAVVAYCSSWIQGADGSHLSLTRGYQQWDANLYVNYAQHGLFSTASVPNNAAFLPGYPLLLALVHLLLRDWLDSALVLSLVADCVLAVLLHRLAGDSRAVLMLFTAPAAVFLMVGYSESVFLAFAVAAWYAAERGRWPAAAVLAALAGLTRIDGLALIPALMVLALAGPPGRRLRGTLYAAGSALGPLVYVLYLKDQTGSWSAWQQANRDGWGLWTDWPWIGLRTTWRGAYEYAFGSGPYAWSFQLELYCTVAAAALVAVLLWRRAWAQACFCGLVLVSMVCVNTQQAADRGLLVCFPLYPILARAAERRAWIGHAYLWVCAPVAVMLGFLYTAGMWAN